MYQTKPECPPAKRRFGPSSAMKCGENARGAAPIWEIWRPGRGSLTGPLFAESLPNQGRQPHGYEEICCRGDRHVLADIRRLRQRRDRRRLSAGRHRPGRRVAGLRAERRHHGLCDRPYLRLPSQSGRHGRPCRRRTLSGRPDRALRDRAGRRRDRRRGAALCDRQRRARLRRRQGLCLQRLWRAFARPVQPGRRASSPKW